MAFLPFTGCFLFAEVQRSVGAGMWCTVCSDSSVGGTSEETRVIKVTTDNVLDSVVGSAMKCAVLLIYCLCCLLFSFLHHFDCLEFLEFGVWDVFLVVQFEFGVWDVFLVLQFFSLLHWFMISINKQTEHKSSNVTSSMSK